MKNKPNRQCQECGGYELDNGVDDVCDCEESDEHPSCDNCGKVLVGFNAEAYEGIEVFCSLKCNQEYLGLS